MTSLSEGNGQVNLQIDDYPLCRMKTSSGVHCNAMPWFYVQNGLMLVPACRKHVSKMLEFATAHTYGDAVVIVVGQVNAYLRRVNQHNTRGGVEA